MQERDRVATIFADAWAMYADAIEILALGKSRIAGEVAWGATKRAADGLILARTGRQPTGTGQTTRGLGRLSHVEPGFALLRARFRRRIGTLHGNCFYMGDCPEHELLVLLIRETNSYIRQAEMLAGMRF